MRDHAGALEAPGAGRDPEPLDLVVIGAGIARMNARNSAPDDLPRGARVPLLRKARASADIARCRRVPDRVADRAGVACGPIT
jgi:hypothetical protein